MARKTVAGCVERINQLYEQGADAVRIGNYVRRWRQCVRSGLDDYALELAVVKTSHNAAAMRSRAA